MKPETGNNNPARGAGVPKNVKTVSIRLASDGHCFSQGAPLGGDWRQVLGGSVVEILTERTLLVPRELFDAESAEALLAAAGMPLARSECAVWSDPGQQIIAVMAAPREMAEAFAEAGNGAACRGEVPAISYTTPLLYAPTAEAHTVWCLHTLGLLYVKVYDGSELRLAEVIPAPAEADVLYFFERLGQAFCLKQYELQIAGGNTDGSGGAVNAAGVAAAFGTVGAKNLRKLLKRRFRRAACV